jgi:hypothetical protein
LDSIQLVDGQEARIDFQTATRGGPTDALMEWGGLIYVTQGLALFALPLAPLQHGEQAVIPKATVMEAFLPGPLLLEQAAIEAAQPKPPDELTGPAFVTFYYPNAKLPFSAQVWCGAVEIGWLPRGRRFTLQLAPGSYSFRVYPGGDPAVVNVTQGANLYLRAALQPRSSIATAPSPVFLLVDHEVGVTESADTKLVEPKKLRDISQINPADLLAPGPPPKKKK